MKTRIILISAATFILLQIMTMFIIFHSSRLDFIYESNQHSLQIKNPDAKMQKVNKIIETETLGIMNRFKDEYDGDYSAINWSVSLVEHNRERIVVRTSGYDVRSAQMLIEHKTYINISGNEPNVLTDGD